eukprot:CAMPEP_0113481806 /NCGR_PEP_ID=MMETSP0014_2-20120614/22596_1 /TAXON_ID=2857 /ORGANISM="Nitzschia sp." /LENGTH=367 /DNA_ID=CAMNT_0000375309 /DNA_START=161 /DNA_END=1264 /DNA_ORIENTATION=+ /assembly_acc=CAM_ASM_000159
MSETNTTESIVDPTTVIHGKVKWFNIRKGFGFITPTSDDSPIKEDVFVHVDSIIVEEPPEGASKKPFKTLKSDFECQFTVKKDEATSDGKYRAMNVKSADGTPCPTPPKRERRRNKKKGDGGDEKTDNDKSDDDAGGTEGENPEGGSKKKTRRKRGGGSKKKGTAAASSGDESDKKKKEEVEKQPTWEDSLDEKVRTSMKDRGITVDSQGRAFLTVGDSARIKLGTDSYAALAHSDGLLAEGEWSVEPTDGKVTITWTKVLKWGEREGEGEGGVWTVSSADDEASLLVSDFCLTDDSVKLTGADETTDKLWGEGKANPKTTLEENGFLMKRMILSHEQANRLKRRGGRGRRYGGKKKSSDNTPVINA